MVIINGIVFKMMTHSDYDDGDDDDDDFYNGSVVVSSNVTVVFC